MSASSTWHSHVVLLAVAADELSPSAAVSPERGQVDLIALVTRFGPLSVSRLHLVRRNWGHGEDAAILEAAHLGRRRSRVHVWLSLKKVFLLQGIVVLWLVSLPIQVAQSLCKTPDGTRLAGCAIGAAVCNCRHRRRVDLLTCNSPASARDPVKRRARCSTPGCGVIPAIPNYFGELCCLVGTCFLLLCENPIGWFTRSSGPLAYTYLIVNVTGQRTLDKKLAREKPAYKLPTWSPPAGLSPCRARSGSLSHERFVRASAVSATPSARSMFTFGKRAWS